MRERHTLAAYLFEEDDAVKGGIKSLGHFLAGGDAKCQAVLNLCHCLEGQRSLGLQILKEPDQHHFVLLREFLGRVNLCQLNGRRTCLLSQPVHYLCSSSASWGGEEGEGEGERWRKGEGDRITPYKCQKKTCCCQKSFDPLCQVTWQRTRDKMQHSQRFHLKLDNLPHSTTSSGVYLWHTPLLRRKEGRKEGRKEETRGESGSCTTS